MKLADVVEEAERLADAGDGEGAESMLISGATLLAGEQDVALLLKYAVACHQLGAGGAEESALRWAVSRGGGLEAIQRLLDLLQQRLNFLKGPARESVASECETLGTTAIEALGQTSGFDWANLVHPRGLRRLDLAKAGHADKIAAARADLEAYRAWLVENESVPAHLQRSNLIAFADVELAELLLLEGLRSEAATRVEAAIAALESGRVAKWMIDPAYEVLERASE